MLTLTRFSGNVNAIEAKKEGPIGALFGTNYLMLDCVHNLPGDDCLFNVKFIDT